VLLLPVVLVTALLGVAAGIVGGPGTGDTPSPRALADIPRAYLAWYVHWAGECPGLNWSVVAAIGKVESDHGRSRLPGVRSGSNWAGAAGPMQFGIGGKAGNTWAVYGRDGDGDGTANVYHPSDAIRAAVAYLCAHGAAAPTRLRAAVFAYNHSTDYVDQVLATAERYRAALPAPQAAALLAHPRIQLTPNARADLQAGVVDPRVVATLAALAQRYQLQVSVLKTGHDRYVAGTRRTSHHYHGRAVDVFQINGQPVSPSNPAARAVTAWLATLSGPLRPDEVGSPFPEFADQPGHFHDQAHLDHIHLGYRPAR
jgi:hypothetical protein